MRIKRLSVSNFRAVDQLTLDGLSDFVLIAGPNGCGKTTILDAVRIVKSVYVADEWKRWFLEFGVNIDRPTNWANVFRDVNRPVEIKAIFELSTSERSFLRASAYNIFLTLALNARTQRAPAAGQAVSGDPPLVPPDLAISQVRALQTQAQRQAQAVAKLLDASAEFPTSVTLSGAPTISAETSPVATAAFSCFNPELLGEIEFHSSRRHYARESVDNIQLKTKPRADERRSRFLYDLENKYKNIKSQLGLEYVTSVLRQEDPGKGPLQVAVKELFKTFFPGKEFLGVKLSQDNALSFPVQTTAGHIHDIDELSSGEKEIVYGYLWLRQGTPRQSVILIDEPELHLNPALVHGLTSFYKRHLAEALDAQVWIVTHSDAILRQGVRSPTSAVFHMSRAPAAGGQQATRIQSKDAVEAAVLDLVGDLAAYRPHAKIVLLEGHKDTRFDVDVVRRLFPEIAERANLIPMGNRSMTQGVRLRLVEVLQETGLSGRAVSICDGDLGLGSAAIGSGCFAWPVYEIENFLLSAPVLRAACVALLRTDPFESDEALINDLRVLARPLVDEMALDDLQHELNGSFIRALKIGASRTDAVNGLVASAAASLRRLSLIDVSEQTVRAMYELRQRRFEGYLSGLEFLERLPGDRLFRALAGRLGLPAEAFKNACLDQAQRQNFRPPGLENVLREAVGPPAT